MTKSFMPRVGASENVLSDGSVLVPGERTTLTPEQQQDPHNKRLIESGQIVEVKTKKIVPTKEATGS